MDSILFIVALQSEAQPIIAFYKLKKKWINEKLFYFNKGRIYCFTTGVGENNVRKRLPHFLNYFPKEKFILINIGIAGGKRNLTAKGQMYIINKIIHDEDGRTDTVHNGFAHGLEEITLTTVSKGITNGGNGYPGLVDMEAATVVDIAKPSTIIQKIIVLKIVSDYMDEILDKPEQVRPLILNQLPVVDKIIPHF